MRAEGTRVGLHTSVGQHVVFEVLFPIPAGYSLVTYWTTVSFTAPLQHTQNALYYLVYLFASMVYLLAYLFTK